MYVAHSYGRRRGLSDEECEVNVQKSIEIGRQLILKGWNPFIPNLYHFVHKGWEDTLDEDKWHEIVSTWIRFCDALFVGSTPAGFMSGVMAEIRIAAQLGLPIYYSLGDVPDGS